MTQADAYVSPRKIADIERLRGLAALLVVICHIAGTFYNLNITSPLPGRVFGWIGACGVALFFVISGFCIRLPEARALHTHGKVRLDVREFLIRRFLRIAPPYWIALIASIGAGYLYKTQQIDGAHSPLDIATHVLVLHSLLPSTFYTINGVFWTIGIEVHFYLAYILFATRPARVWMAAALLVLALAAYGAASRLMAMDNPWRTVGQQFFITSFWQWYIGALIADWWVKRPRTGPGLLLWPARIVLFVFTLALGLTDPKVAGLHINGWILPCAAAVLVLLFVIRPAGAGEDSPLLEPANVLGRASYSLYLFHPVALSIGAFAVAGRGWPVWVGAVISLFLALALAAAAYGLIEKPLLAWRARLRKPSAPPREAAVA